MDFLENECEMEMDADMCAVESADIALNKCLIGLKAANQLYELNCMERGLQYMAESGG